MEIPGPDQLDIGRLLAERSETPPELRLKLAYRLNFTGPRTGNSLLTDLFRAGEVEFVGSDVSDSDPQHSLEYDLLNKDGLRLSVVRPVGATVNIGHWAAVPLRLSAEQLPEAFLLVAAFNRPRQTPLDQFVDGTFAPSLLIFSQGAMKGATCQFRTDGVRLNLPGTGVTPNRPSIDQAFVDAITARPPAPVTLGLFVDRRVDPVRGVAHLYVGNEEADSHRFSFATFTQDSGIRHIRAGIGTASGEGYRASVFLLDFQIWVNLAYSPPLQP